MKERRRDPEKVKNWDAIERFVAGGEGPSPPAAPATEAPTRPPVEVPAVPAKPATRSRPPAEGYIRSTFDIPRDLHTALKEEAIRRSTARGRNVSMREVVEEKLREWLAQG